VTYVERYRVKIRICGLYCSRPKLFLRIIRDNTRGFAGVVVIKYFKVSGDNGTSDSISYLPDVNCPLASQICNYYCYVIQA